MMKEWYRRFLFWVLSPVIEWVRYQYEEQYYWNELQDKSLQGIHTREEERGECDV